MFIDSRQDPYPVPFVQEYIRMEETGDYRAVFERYQIRCAVLPTSSLVAQQLLRDGWAVTATDAEWQVITRQSTILNPIPNPKLPIDNVLPFPGGAQAPRLGRRRLSSLFQVVDTLGGDGQP